MLTFQKKYALIALLLFFIEVYIAIFVRDRFVRPYVGDFLVVILIYCFIKSFLNADVLKTALSLLIFSYLVELSQYFKLIIHLHLQNSRLAKIILGSSFQWFDILAYTMGIIVVLGIEKMRMKF